MRYFEMGENIILELPSKYTIKQEIDEEGDLNTTIESGEYMNDEGIKCCEFQGNISYYTIDPDDYDEEINGKNLLEIVANSRELDNTLKLPVQPEILLGNKEISISVLGSTLDIFLISMLIKATDNSYVLLVTSKTSEDDARSDDVFYDSIVEIAESIRIFGKKVSLEGISPQDIERHFESISGDDIFKYDFVEDYVLGRKDEYGNEPREKKSAGKQTASSSASKKKSTTKSSATDSSSKGKAKKQSPKKQNTDFSMKKQKGIHAVKKDKERVIVDWMWSMEVPSGFSYSADYECNAPDIDGGPYAFQIQKTEGSDFSEGYPSEINVAVRQANMSFNMYTSDARIAKDALMEYGALVGDTQVVKENKNILVIFTEAYMFSDAYNFNVCVGGRNVAYTGQVMFQGEAQNLDTKSIALDFVKSIEPVLLSDLKEMGELVRLDEEYLPNLDTGNYLTVDDNFRIPVPDGYDAFDNPYGIIEGPRAAVIPEGSQWSERGYRCKVGFIVRSDPGDIGNHSTKEIVDAYKRMMEEESGFDLFNNPITTVRDTSKGTIVYSTVVTNAADENTNPVLIITGGKAYYCMITIAYDRPIADDYDVMWDAKVITTAWLSRILFKGESKPKKKAGKAEVKEDIKTVEFTAASPDESLYPHYSSKMNAGNSGLPGAMVIVNQSGTEYQFLDVKDDLDEDAADEMREAVDKLNDTGATKYKLADRVIEMRPLFHVNPDVFDSQHDKECELAEGMMHRAYMMNALRSFAWTLSAYCKELKVEPKDIDLEQIQEIIYFIKKANWLNYDGKSFCKGLCGTQDVHVFYLPDRTPKAVKDVFLPSQEILDQTKQMQEHFPNCNPILDQVGSLNKLRKDLEYIYPAIKKIYESLKESRNYDEPLTGDEADILYAWCAVAYAARAPFYSEDGPMNCCFEQIQDDSFKYSNGSRRKIINNESLTVADVPKSMKRFINGDKEEQYAARMIPGTAFMDEPKEYYYLFYYWTEKDEPGTFEIIKDNIGHAKKYLSVFTNDEKVEIENGYLKTTEPIHALRSFIWTAVEIQEDTNCFPPDLSKEELKNLISFLQVRESANYEMSNKTSDRFGFALLGKQEVKNEFYSTMYPTPGKDEVKLKRYLNNADNNSLIELARILNGIIPAMESLFEIATEDEGFEAKDEIMLLLKAWCMFAFAGKQPFFIIPDRYCPEAIDVDYEFFPKVEKVGEGRYSLIEDVLVDCDDERTDVTIPLEVKSLSLVNTVHNEKFYENFFPNAKTVTYHKDYKGKIFVPKNAKEVIVDSEIDELEIVNHKEEKLEKIAFNGTLRVLGDNCLSNSDYLKEVVLPNGLERINDGALTFDNSLQKINFPEGLRYIGSGVLIKSRIHSITIPESVEYIGDNAFNNIEDLELIVYKESFGQGWAKDFAKAVKAQEEIWTWGMKSVRVIELDPAWKESVDWFIKRIKQEYQNPERKDISGDAIRNIIDNSEISSQQYKSARDYISERAKKNGLSVLGRAVDECESLDALKNNLPELLKEDINLSIKESVKAENNNADTSDDTRSTKNETSIEKKEKEIIDLEKEIEAKKHELEEIEEQAAELKDKVMGLTSGSDYPEQDSSELSAGEAQDSDEKPEVNANPEKSRKKVFIIIAISVIIILIAALIIGSSSNSEPTTNNSNSDNEVEVMESEGFDNITSGKLRDDLLKLFKKNYTEVTDETESQFDNNGSIAFAVDGEAVIIYTQKNEQDYDYDSPIDYCAICTNNERVTAEYSALVVSYLFNDHEYEEIKNDIQKKIEKSKEEADESDDINFEGLEYSDYSLYCAYNEKLNIVIPTPPDIDINDILEWFGF